MASGNSSDITFAYALALSLVTTLTLLDGRNGDTLRKWLKNNKNVKVVTRDKASAYAKIISEELPDAMQVADRFHLHQNLLETIKKALKIQHNYPHQMRFFLQCSSASINVSLCGMLIVVGIS